MRLLLVEDDKELCDTVAATLEQEGYEADRCYDGEEAYFYIKGTAYDAVLLDRMLPGMDGLELLKKIRKEGVTVPVILATALGELGDRVDGLDTGADDYLIKPYAVEELSARIRALLRRPREVRETEELKFEDLVFQLRESVLLCGEMEKHLSKKESSLLEYLMKNGGRTLTREQILFRVWGLDAEIEDGNIDNYIYFLRRRLKALHSVTKITTVHGVGYRLERIL